VEAAALRMGELADDPDDGVRWAAAMGLDMMAPRIRGATRGALFGRALKLGSDPYSRARGAAAVAIAGLVGGDGGADPREARAPIAKLLADPEVSVQMWAMDASAKVAPTLEGSDREELTMLVLDRVLQSEPSVVWKAGRTLVAMTAGAAPDLGGLVVDKLLLAAARAGGDEAVVLVDLAAELRPRLHPEMASLSVAKLVDLARANEEELGLRALRAAAVFAATAPIEVGNPTTQALARMATDDNPLRRDGALLCLGAIGAWAGPFGTSVQADGAIDIALHLISYFHSPDASVRRWARDMWPLAFGACAPDRRDLLLEKLLESHGDEVLNVRAAASFCITSVRPTLTDAQARRVADGLFRLLRHPDGDTKRQTTVTLVHLFEVLGEGKRGEVLNALSALTEDPDPVVADQARDSIAAVGEFRRRQAKAAAALT
jgi:hypothetical protein